MKKILLISGILLFTLLISNCDTNDENQCQDIFGIYTGVIAGSFNGTITLVISERGLDIANLEGTWIATDQDSGDSYTGEINLSSVNCATGRVDSEYGFGLSGPYDILCPESETWCYNSGATLGKFEGTITSGSGVGTWTANSGAAETVGVMGSGTWTVSKN